MLEKCWPLKIQAEEEVLMDSLTWPACRASRPSSLLLPTSDVRPSTSAPRATSWYGDTAEGEEEVKSGGPARTASLHHHE